MMSVVGFFAFVAALYFWWLWRRETARAAGPTSRRRRQWEGLRLFSFVAGSRTVEIAPPLTLVPASSWLRRLDDTFEVFDDSFQHGFLEVEHPPIERPPQMAVVPYSVFPTSHHVLNETYVIENAEDLDGPLGDPKLNYFFAPFTKEDVFNSTFSVDGANGTSHGEPRGDGENSVCDCTACIFRGWPDERESSESDSGETSWTEESESDSSGSDDPCLGIRLAPVGRRIGDRGDFNPSWLKPTKTSIMREALAQKRKKQENARSVKSGKRGSWR